MNNNDEFRGTDFGSFLLTNNLCRCGKGKTHGSLGNKFFRWCFHFMIKIYQTDKTKNGCPRLLIANIRLHLFRKPGNTPFLEKGRSIDPRFNINRRHHLSDSAL